MQGGVDKNISGRSMQVGSFFDVYYSNSIQGVKDQGNTFFIAFQNELLLFLKRYLQKIGAKGGDFDEKIKKEGGILDSEGEYDYRNIISLLCDFFYDFYDHSHSELLVDSEGITIGIKILVYNIDFTIDKMLGNNLFQSKIKETINSIRQQATTTDIQHKVVSIYPQRDT